VDYDKNEVHYTANGKEETIHFDKLLIATGGSAVVPPIKGNDLKNILTLRSAEDATKIKKGVEHAKNIVVVGASFIGMETASALKKELKDKVNVTVVDVMEVPFERVLGKEVGGAL